MSTSGPIVAGRYGATLYTYPISGTFAADRAALIGNTSGADGQTGTNVLGALSFPPITNYRTNQVGLDGTDVDDTAYDEQTVVVPVVIYESDPYAALVEWRRIVAAVSPRHRRAALEVTDPNTIGQKARWLTRLVLDDVDEQPLRHDRFNFFVGRLVFVTDGEPWWTPDPGALGPGPYVGYVSNQVFPTDNAVNQLSLAYTGTEGGWPFIQWQDLLGCTISLTLAATGQQVDIVDTGPGFGSFDFDRRTRDPATDSLVAPFSELFQIPPTNPSRVDVVIGSGTPGGSARVTISVLPRFSTAGRPRSGSLTQRRR